MSESDLARGKAAGVVVGEGAGGATSEMVAFDAGERRAEGSELPQYLRNIEPVMGFDFSGFDKKINMFSSVHELIESLNEIKLFLSNQNMCNKDIDICIEYIEDEVEVMNYLLKTKSGLISV